MAKKKQLSSLTFLAMLRFPVSVKLEVLELEIWLIISKREAKFLPETCKASKKVADAKLAKDFQAVLKEFQKTQRLAAERETSYASSVLKAVLPLRYLSVGRFIWK
ncbi:hypothetical protein PVK06_024465 [Gossypium arboreum]|uniref:Syntaxin N-terminal domain-containing protein n=1 Tax=Gossypium arboreum TaxID=29729 RepID=A0ABR0PE04_GOSAR|nr:hypothetical protein PVK06_024465 [Gossypium arboreum]